MMWSSAIRWITFIARNMSRGIRFDDPTIGVDWGEVVEELLCAEGHDLTFCFQTATATSCIEKCDAG